MLTTHLIRIAQKPAQEPAPAFVPHKDYLPDVTGPEPEADYDPEEDDQGGEEEYDDYQDNLQQ